MASPLDAAIRQTLAPVLRADGFSGSGRAFRREINGFVCIVLVQAGRSGDKFAINLSLHPRLLPTMNSKSANTLINDADCEFRRRLSAEGGDHWWPYTDEISLQSALAAATCLYERLGRRLFAEQTALDAPILTTTSARYATEGIDLSGFAATDVRQAYALAVIRHLAGERDEAVAFAGIALARLGGASGLRRELEALMAGTWRFGDEA